MFNVASNILAGPAVSTSYPLGRYMEDNDFLGDHGIASGTNTYDLDEYNGRWCVTPEFPNGTYAYFVAIAADGTPVFPYNIGRGYYGSPAGGSVDEHFGNCRRRIFSAGRTPRRAQCARGQQRHGHSDLERDGRRHLHGAVHNRFFNVDHQFNHRRRRVRTRRVTRTIRPDNYRFYRVAQTALATYDSAGSGTAAASSGGGASYAVPGNSTVSRGSGTNITLVITLPGNPPSPPANAPITSVTLGSLTATSFSDATSGTVLANFTIPSNATTGEQTVVVTFTSGPPPYSFSNALDLTP